MCRSHETDIGYIISLIRDVKNSNIIKLQDSYFYNKTNV